MGKFFKTAEKIAEDIRTTAQKASRKRHLYRAGVREHETSASNKQLQAHAKKHGKGIKANRRAQHEHSERQKGRTPK